MPFVNANGVEFFFQRMGAGEPTVVFVHGLVMDNLSSWWYTIANALARQSDVLCYDLRGHGLSQRPRNGYSVSDSVLDLTNILSELGIEGPIHIVGNSYGGVVGLALALERPSMIASLVLVEAHASIDELRSKDKAQLVHGLDLAGVFLDDDEVNQWLDSVGGRKLNRMAKVAKALIYDTSLADDLRDSPPFTRAQLEQISCPTLLIYGEHSDIISRGIVLQELLSNARLEVVKGLDHSVLMGATQFVRTTICEWIRDHSVDRGMANSTKSSLLDISKD